MARTGVVLIIALAALAGGCATGRAAMADDQDALAAPDATTWVHASNQNWQDIDLYLVRPGLKVRLGMVTAMGSMSFRVPSTAMGGTPGLQLLVAPIGGGPQLVTPEFNLVPGETLSLEIENQLQMSSYSIR